MTPLRFRAWDYGCDPTKKKPGDTSGKMSIVDQLSWDGHGDLAEINEEMPRWFALMRFTGLKDVNGHDIFENDVVAYSSQKGEERAVVLYDDPAGCWILASLDGFTLAGHTYHSAEPIYRVGSDILQIVGNVYENPELLK